MTTEDGPMAEALADECQRLFSVQEPDPPLGWRKAFPTRRPIRHGTVNGIRWAVAQNAMTFDPTINGYAQIPAEGHLWSSCTDYGQIPVSIHGGLTFGPHPANPRCGMAELTLYDIGGWVGFDTHHAFDTWTREALAEAGVEPAVKPDWYPEMPPMPGLTRSWTLDLVIEEAQALAMQISVATEELRNGDCDN